MKKRNHPTIKGAVCVIMIGLILLLAGYYEANAMVSLEQQRFDREIAAQRRHQVEIEQIRAAAYVKAAKYEARRY